MAVTFNGVPGFATPGAFVPGEPLLAFPLPPIHSGTPPAIPTSGGDRGYTIRVFREIRPGDVPSSGAQLPRLTGRAFLVPVPDDVEHTGHAWDALEIGPLEEAGPSALEQARAQLEQAGVRALEVGRIFADPPYQRQPKKCGAIRKIGGVMLTCRRKPGHAGTHSDRGLDWR